MPLLCIGYFVGLIGNTFVVIQPRSRGVQWFWRVVGIDVVYIAVLTGFRLWRLQVSGATRGDLPDSYNILWVVGSTLIATSSWLVSPRAGGQERNRDKEKTGPVQI